MTGPVIIAASPFAYILVYLIFRAAMRITFGQNPSGAAFAVAQAINVVFGIFWGAMLVACLYALTGLPSDPMKESGPGLLGGCMMLLPAIVMTLKFDNYVSRDGFRLFAGISLAVIALGLPASLAQKTEGHAPGVGVHVVDVVHGASMMAVIANTNVEQA